MWVYSLPLVSVENTRRLVLDSDWPLTRNQMHGTSQSESCPKFSKAVFGLARRLEACCPASCELPGTAKGRSWGRPPKPGSTSSSEIHKYIYIKVMQGAGK